MSHNVKTWVTAALALMLWTARGPAADWGQWRGPNRDGHVAPGEKVPITLPAELKPRWRMAVGEGFSSPVVAGGRSAVRVFYGDLLEGKEVVDGATH